MGLAIAALFPVISRRPEKGLTWAARYPKNLGIGHLPLILGPADRSENYVAVGLDVLTSTK